MNTVMARAKKAAPDRVHFWCPGCEMVHGVAYAFPAPYGPDWTWNGDLDRPTITPSIIVQGDIRCHSYVTDGRIEFLSDCTHPLAGQTVDLPEWPHGSA